MRTMRTMRTVKVPEQEKMFPSSAALCEYLSEILYGQYTEQELRSLSFEYNIPRIAAKVSDHRDNADGTQTWWVEADPERFFRISLENRVAKTANMCPLPWLIPLNDAATLLGVSRQTLLRWGEERSLPITQFRSGGKIFISTDALREFIAKHTTPAKEA